jgi:hypothetical protein
MGEKDRCYLRFCSCGGAMSREARDAPSGSPVRVSPGMRAKNLGVKQQIDLRMAMERTVQGNGSRS